MSLISGIYWFVRKQSALYLLFNFYMGNFINQAIKMAVCAYRPWIRDGRITPVESANSRASGYSFPSRHTAKAMAVWGGLAVHDFKRKKNNSKLSATHYTCCWLYPQLFRHPYSPRCNSVPNFRKILYIRYSLSLIWADKKRGRDWITAGCITLALYYCNLSDSDPKAMNLLRNYDWPILYWHRPVSSRKMADDS